MLTQQIVNAIWLGSVYSLFALGYTLVFGVLDILNLAHGAVFMWGAFFGLMAVTWFGLSIWSALLVAIIGAGLLGILVERLAFKPLRQLTLGNNILWAGFVLTLFSFVALASPTFTANAPILTLVLQLLFGAGLVAMVVGLVLDYLEVKAQPPRSSPHLSTLISSIGASTILVSLAQASFGAQVSRFPAEVFTVKALPLGAVRVTNLQLIILVIALVLMFALALMLKRTKVGRAMRSVAFSERIASLMGVHVDRLIMQTFFLSSALAGAAGVLLGLALTSISPFMGNNIALKGLVVIVLGGLGNIQGAVLGGFLLALTEVLSVAYISSDFRDAIAFTVLFLVLLVKPTGLLGTATQKKA
jgi:branched-chain amino acid transport system permease protein